MQKTLGGDRLGSGKRQKIELHNYERSTHDLSYLWRSTMSAGTLVPFMSEIALPGDSFDIDLDTIVMTHPTIGPLFGSYKVQMDIFLAPIRLYNSLLHNNALGIGLNMSKVKLPILRLTAPEVETIVGIEDLDNSQINPSSLPAYLGIRGIGTSIGTSGLTRTRDFNGVPTLAYWEIYKNYYANKQEEIGAVLHTPSVAIVTTVDDITIITGPSSFEILSVSPAVSSINVNYGQKIDINFTGTTPIPSQLIFTTSQGEFDGEHVAVNWTDLGGVLEGQSSRNDCILYNWRYRDSTDINTGKPAIATFPLSNIDDMRNAILAFSNTNAPFDIIGENIEPYVWLGQNVGDINNILSSQEGLGLKTYQSDLFNNWLQTEWIDGTGGINDVTSIDTSSGSFTVDTLILAKKVYNMLNRIAVSGGTYDDWLDAVYTNERYTRAESPMYMGGLIKELVFQEVVSNSASEEQPLGTLAGRGTLNGKHKGGKIVVKVDEPGYIIGIVSLTPRLDYSQGNKWDTTLQTLDDLHKPALDEIGFQELITEQMAWWDTTWDTVTSSWIQQSAGKQPAWMNYMTNVNQTRGNFAIPTNEMFMTLNRRYEPEEVGVDVQIKDLTTYIDPSKYNNIFAETALDAQNFWVQIAVDITARRKMSAKVMPNL
ncbi:MAG: major capsid protein [Microviridae sp.]|nr:MAG: major capsid protein [Microviridae sp.]